MLTTNKVASILLEFNEEKRNKLIDDLSENAAKQFAKILVQVLKDIK